MVDVFTWRSIAFAFWQTADTAFHSTVGFGGVMIEKTDAVPLVYPIGVITIKAMEFIAFNATNKGGLFARSRTKPYTRTQFFHAGEREHIDV